LDLSVNFISPSVGYTGLCFSIKSSHTRCMWRLHCC
jgi:hypothetical protein